MINSTIKPKIIYHENSNYLLFPKSNRHIEILGKDFKILNSYYTINHMSISPFLGGSGRYREFILERK